MYKYLHIFIVVLIACAGFFAFGAKEARADCTVVSAQFRTNGFSINYWFDDENPPYVYIDFTTQGCVEGDDTFELSITESDANSLDSNDDDDVNGTAVNCNESQSFCIDNREIEVPLPANDFTAVMQAGEDECGTLDSPHCSYYIRINDNVLGGVSDIGSTSHLPYNCDNTCDEDWEWIGLIDFQSNHPDDPGAFQGGGGAGGGSIIGTQTIPVNIENPIGANTMTITDLIQKVLEFAVKIGIPIVAIAIIYSGLLFVTARGSDAQLETAKNAFTYAVIGGAILLGCWIFASLIKEAIEGVAMIMNYVG